MKTQKTIKLSYKNILVYFFMLLFISSCIRENEIEEKIIGIWIGNANYYNNPDPQSNINYSLEQGLPILIDIKENGTYIMKIFGNGQMVMDWKIDPDSFFNINNKLKYKIISLTDTSLCFRFNMDQYKMVRVDAKSIELDSSSIVGILKKNVWSGKAGKPNLRQIHGYENYIDYLIDDIRILKYCLFDNEDSSSCNLLGHAEKWALVNYEDYYFIVNNYINSPGSLPYDIIKQIIYIDSTKYITKTKNGYKTLYGFQYEDREIQQREFLIGKWVGYNTSDDWFVGKINQKAVERGLLELYVGPLFFIFEEDIFSLYGFGTDTIVADWLIDDEGTWIVLKKRNYINDNVLESLETIQFRRECNDNLILLLESNILNPIKEPPKKYLINTVQKVKRIK